MKHYLTLIGIATVVAGCSSNPPAEQGAARAIDRQPVAGAPSAAAKAPAATGTAANANATADADALANSAAPAKRSVYFDYDSNVVKEEYAPVVTSNARYVSQRKVSRVVIEGNTDERGSREYNLALGQRRADAVKQRMTLLGVPAQQIETVSFGEEKPRVDAGTEQAFVENRRADIVYQ